MSIFSWTKKRGRMGWQIGFHPFERRYVLQEAGKTMKKRRYFNADMGIAVCPLSNSRTFWPFELTSDRRVSPILPISTLQSPNQGAIHKLRSQGSFGALLGLFGTCLVHPKYLFGPFLVPICTLSVSFLCPFCALSVALSVPFLCSIVSFLCPFCALLGPFLCPLYRLNRNDIIVHLP